MSGCSTSKSTASSANGASAPAAEKTQAQTHKTKIAPEQSFPKVLHHHNQKQSDQHAELDEEEMERQRKYSASEPLLPEAINLIQSELHRCDKFSLPHVFVVFGASVSYFVIFALKTMKKC